MIPLRAEWLKSEPVSVLSKLSFETGASFADDRSRPIEAREFKAVSPSSEIGSRAGTTRSPVEKDRTRRGSRNKHDS